VLVVMGKLSWVLDVVPDWRQRVAEFADARVAEIDGVGHMIHHEDPGALTDAILPFLDSLPDR
jgi:pimeloyl-ACP methyl ester carboxylesterase